MYPDLGPCWIQRVAVVPGQEQEREASRIPKCHRVGEQVAENISWRQRGQWERALSMDPDSKPPVHAHGPIGFLL